MFCCLSDSKCIYRHTCHMEHMHSVHSVSMYAIVSHGFNGAGTLLLQSLMFILTCNTHIYVCDCICWVLKYRLANHYYMYTSLCIV